MSLGKIVLLSMLLGLLVGVIVSALTDAVSPSLVGAGVAFASVVTAGRIQPVPRRRR